MSNFIIFLKLVNIIMVILFGFLLFAKILVSRKQNVTKLEMRVRYWNIGVETFFVLSNAILAFSNSNSRIIHILNSIVFVVCIILDISAIRNRILYDVYNKFVAVSCLYLNKINENNDLALKIELLDYIEKIIYQNYDKKLIKEIKKFIEKMNEYILFQDQDNIIDVESKECD